MQVLSSLSGIPFYAPSAGFSPTNSADVSSIASAYAESAASSKLDESATANFYPTSNPSGFISGVDLSDYATTADLANKLDTTAQVVTAVSTATSDVGGYTYTWVNGINGISISAMTSDVAGAASTATYDSEGRRLTALAASSSLANYQTTAGMSAYATTGYVESGVSSKLDTTAFSTVSGNFLTAVPAGYATETYVDSSVSSLPDSATVSAIASAYTTGKQDTLAFEYNTANQISSINGSALGGMDEAAVSSIASAYAEAAASGKLDSSAFSAVSGNFLTAVPAGYASEAYVDSAVSSKLDSTAFNSADFYTTANESSFVDSAYVDSAISGKLDTSAFSAVSGTFLTSVDLTPYQTTADMSGYIPTSMSSDFQQVTGMSAYALSSDVSATVDLVGTQSANWGGSALALSAGPGVKLEKVGDTLVAGLDETVLWSGSTTNITGITLNETYGNFDRVRFYWKPWTDDIAWRVTEIPSFAYVFTLDAGWASNAQNGLKALFAYSISSNGTAFSQIQGGFQNITGGNTWSTAANCSVVKVVGINHTAGT